MRSCVFAFAVVALAVPSFAFAGDTKQDKKVVPALTTDQLTTKQMTESDMDKVTAGNGFYTGNGSWNSNSGGGNAYGIDRGGGAYCLNNYGC